MISLKKLRIFTPLRKLPKTVRDLGKFIVAKGMKKLPKVENIAQSGYTAPNSQSSLFDANALVNYHPIQLDNA